MRRNLERTAPIGKHGATVASGATLLAHCKNHLDAFGELNQVVGLNSGITVIPVGSIA